MLKGSKRGNILMQCIVGMAILFCFILMVSTFNFIHLKKISRNTQFERISDYIVNFKREIKMEETPLNRAKQGEVFYLSETELKSIHIKEVGELIKEVKPEGGILKILIVEENEFTNKIRLIYLGEKVEVEEETYVWRAKKRADLDRGYMFNGIHRNNEYTDM